MPTAHEIISLKIADLADALTTSHPRMPSLLRDIHTHLKNDPDVVTLLSADDVSIIIEGLAKQTQTTITTSILSGSKGKSLKKISVDDI